MTLNEWLKKQEKLCEEIGRTNHTASKIVYDGITSLPQALKTIHHLMEALERAKASIDTYQTLPNDGPVSIITYDGRDEIDEALSVDPEEL